MRSVQIVILPLGRVLVDMDKLTHAVPQDEGTRLFHGAQTLDVPHSHDELENVLGGASGRTAGPSSGGVEGDRDPSAMSSAGYSRVLS